MPGPPTRERKEQIRKAIWKHPKFGTEPLVRLLLIPQSETAPIRPIELENGPNYQRELCRLLNSKLTDSEVLHSEDLFAAVRVPISVFYRFYSVVGSLVSWQWKGRPDGVGVDKLHSSYEVYMDDNALSERPLNKRASDLLRRPNTHGPVLVMKTTFLKSQPDMIGRCEDILCWERVTVDELKGEQFRKLREEWIASKCHVPVVLSVEPAHTGQAAALKLQGNAAFGRGEYKQAFIIYSACAKISEREPVFLLNRAAAALKLKLFKCAEEDANAAMGSTPMAKACYRRGQARKFMGMLEQAAGDLVNARRMQPSDNNIAMEIEELNKLKSLSGAEIESWVASQGALEVEDVFGSRKKLKKLVNEMIQMAKEDTNKSTL